MQLYLIKVFIFYQRNDEDIFPVFPMNKVEGISQKISIVKSTGNGSLNRTLARKWPTLIDGKKFLEDDFPDVDKSKQEKK